MKKLINLINEREISLYKVDLIMDKFAYRLNYREIVYKQRVGNIFEKSTELTYRFLRRYCK